MHFLLGPFPGSAHRSELTGMTAGAIGEVVVIGVGNPYRRDDGFGVAVLERLWQRQRVGGGVLADVEVAEESGEPVALISRWAGHDTAILIDAVSSGGEPGTLHRVECSDGNWDVGRMSRQASTHGLGVAEAVALGRTLGRLPRRLVIIGAETADVANGSGLSSPVSAAVGLAEDSVMAELGRICRGNDEDAEFGMA